MEIVKNLNIVSGPVVRKAATKPAETSEQMKTLQMLVENETRRMLDVARKFMHSAKREEIEVVDIYAALQYMGLRDIKLTGREGTMQSEDAVHSDLDQFLRVELYDLAMHHPNQRIYGRWIYIGYKIPRTQDNLNISNLYQILYRVSMAYQSASYKFNVIKDYPDNLLGSEYLQLYKAIVSDLENNKLPSLEECNPTNIMPFIMAYMLSVELKDTNFLFLIELLNNKHVSMVIEYHLHQFMKLLICYEGRYVWEAGLKLAQIIEKWGNKYRNLYQEVSRTVKGYPQLIKYLALRVYFRRPIEPKTQTLFEDIEKGIPFAYEYLQRINQSTSRLKSSLEVEEWLTEGLAVLTNDSYIQSFL